jgi:hypothetical protein
MTLWQLRQVDDAVAVEAGTAAGNAGVAAGLRAAVAVEAVDAHLTGMQPVGERDGLLGRVPLLVARQVRRAHGAREDRQAETEAHGQQHGGPAAGSVGEH